MFKERICRTLGAGATAPYGFPPGKQLMDSICDSPGRLVAPCQGNSNFDRRKHVEFGIDWDFEPLEPTAMRGCANESIRKWLRGR